MVVRLILRCGPTGGSMPEAARLCGDIANHPTAMLAPSPSRSVCAGAVFGPIVYVHAYGRGRTTFSGEPGCGWPAGTALAVYWAASRGDTRALSLLEPRLRCDDDPVLLAKPTPWRSVFACTHGLWTPRTAKLIRIGETLPQIAALRPRGIFPSQIGVKRCLMSAGGPRHHLLVGYCEVNVKRVWRGPRVSFSESWPAGKKIARHTWIVSVINGKPRLASEHGATPPQGGINDTAHPGRKVDSRQAQVQDRAVPFRRTKKSRTEPGQPGSLPGRNPPPASRNEELIGSDPLFEETEFLATEFESSAPQKRPGGNPPPMIEA